MIIGCYDRETLETHVRVRINQSVSVLKSNSGNSNLIEGIIDEWFISRLLEGLQSEVKVSNVVIDNNAPQFEIK